MEPSTKHKEDLATFRNELRESYFGLFDIAAKLHLMTVPKGVNTLLFENTKTTLDLSLSNLSELMARLDETDEPLDTRTLWWQLDHWLFR